MHQFSSPIDLTGPPPNIGDFAFNDALDVIEYAGCEGGFERKRSTEIWHLDQAGTYCCGSRFSPDTDIRRLADQPGILRESRRQGLATGGCPDRWLVNEYQAVRRDGRPPDEGDVQAYRTVLTMLAGLGVHLVDCLVWGPDMRCWSLHELTSGTTRWDPPRRHE